MRAQSRTTWALPSLVAARIVYAINWTNIGALFYLMSSDLGGGITGLGILTSSFYLGVGTMQIPGGILAAKQGPKKTVTMGIFISSLAVLGTSISTVLVEVAVLRFIVGAGMALVFSPAVVLATRFLKGKSGTGAGIINSAFSLGGVLGLFAWILLAETTGWRPSLILSSSLGLVTGLLVLTLVPKDPENTMFRPNRDALTRILRNRNLIILGFGALSSNIGAVLVSNFMEFYLRSELGETAVLAGLVTALIVALPIVTALWGGRTYDRTKRPRPLLVISGIGLIGALAICAVRNVIVASLGVFLAGIAVGPAFTVAFAAANDLSNVEKEYESLTIGWVNCISLTGSVWPSVVFSFLAGSLGYTAAWFGGAVMTLACLTPVLLLTLQPPRRKLSVDYRP